MTVPVANLSRLLFLTGRTLLKKVRQLDALKDAGNDAFKAGQQDEAIGKYTEALELAEDNDTLRATLFSNRASARLKVNEMASQTKQVLLAGS